MYAPKIRVRCYLWIFSGMLRYLAINCGCSICTTRWSHYFCLSVYVCVLLIGKLLNVCLWELFFAKNSYGIFYSSIGSIWPDSKDWNLQLENGFGAECHRQGREVKKYQETGLRIVDFGLFIVFVNTRKNITMLILAEEQVNLPVFSWLITSTQILKSSSDILPANESSLLPSEMQRVC